MSLFRYLVIAAVLVGSGMAYFDFAHAQDYSQFLDNSGGDAEQKLGASIKTIVNWILYLAVGCALLTGAWGFVNYSGWIGSPQEAAGRWKAAVIIFIGGGAFWAIARIFAEMAS